MSRQVEGASTRVSAVLAGVVGVTLAVLVPPLLTAVADPSAGITVAVLAVAMAAWMRLGRPGVLAATGAEAVVRRSGDNAPPTLSCRVTDPVHHPLRPRAPGLA
jgi:hypothetical protein